MLPLLLAIYVVVAIAAVPVVRAMGRRGVLMAAVAPAASLVWIAWVLPRVLDGRPVSGSVTWVPALGLELSFRVDAFSLLMVAIVAGVGLLILGYAGRYFHGDETGLPSLTANLLLFAGSMTGLVTADNVYAIFLFWELTSITSYLLIGTANEQGSVRAAAQQALIVTSTGGLAMLAGLVLISQAAGTASLSAILAEPPSGATVSVGLVLVLVGAFAKSAQVPLHFWLPSAMVAPTPVSAYLHSATMVKAGIYLIARFAPAFASAGPWRPLIVIVGLASMLHGGVVALRQHDLKLLLAYGTVSQLGLLVILFGLGDPDLTRAGVAMLVAHALFKAALFMTVGIVDHQAHTRDLRVLSGLGRRLPMVCAVALRATASMAALPPLFGFVAKESALHALLHAHGAWSRIALVGVVAGSVLTVAYSARFAWGAFATKSDAPGPVVGAAVLRPPVWFVAPAAMLAALSLLLGLAPALVSTWLDDAASTLDPLLHPEPFHLWAGLNLALALSALTVVLGGLVFVARRRVQRVLNRGPHPVRGEVVYRETLTGANRVADAVTGVLQNGSLPAYVAVVLLTLVAGPGFVLLTRTRLPDDPGLAASPMQAVLVVGIVFAAVVAARSRRRFSAVLALGAVGFGVAGLFVLQGAPDLALTQILIETLAVVAFVLVLRHLPDHFPRTSVSQVWRIAVAGTVGAFAAGAVLVTTGARRHASDSAAFLRDALPEAGGRNVVNVILVDFRGFDTLGEITVLVVAGLGVAALVGGARRRTRATGENGENDEGSDG